MFTRPRRWGALLPSVSTNRRVPRICVPGFLMVCASLVAAWPCGAAERTIDGAAPGIPEKIEAPPADNKHKQPGLPAGTTPFPEDFRLEIKQGEALCGCFKLKDGAEAVCFANSNRYAWQGMLIVPKQDPKNPTTIWELNQESGQWVELGAWGDVNFPIAPAGSAVFKFK